MAPRLLAAQPRNRIVGQLRFWCFGWRGPSCMIAAACGHCKWRHDGCRHVLCRGLTPRGWAGFQCRPALARRFVWSSFLRPPLRVVALSVLAVALLPVLALAAWGWLIDLPARSGRL